MALTIATKNNILNQLTGQVMYGIAGSCYIGLGVDSESAPDPSTGEGFVEPTAGEYERPFLSTTGSEQGRKMAAANNGEVHNNSIIFFNEVTTEGGWGTVKYFGLFTGATGGNPYLFGTLTNQVTIEKDKVPLFRANALSISIE